MAKISPTAAASKWNISKTTIYKHMNAGELSFTVNEKGKRVLDVSELVRVFGEPERTEKQSFFKVEEELKRQNERLFEIMQARIEAQERQIESLTSAVERFSLMIEGRSNTQVNEAVSPQLKPESIKQETQKPVKKKTLFSRILAAVAED